MQDRRGVLLKLYFEYP